MTSITNNRDSVTKYKAILYWLVALYAISPASVHLFNVRIGHFILMCAMVIWFGIKKKLEKKVPLRINWFFAISFALLLTSCVVHLEFIEVFVFLFSIFLLIYMIRDVIESPTDFMKFIDVLIAISAFVAVLGLLEEITRFNIVECFNQGALVRQESALLYRYGILRVSVFFSHPINYACFLLFASGLCLYRLNTLGVNKTKYIIILSLLLLNSALTLSRLALLGLLLLLVLVFILSGSAKKADTLILAISSIGLFFLVVFLVPGPIGDFFRRFIYMMLGIFFEQFQSLVGYSSIDNIDAIGNRFDLYGWVIESVGSNYLFGMGGDSTFSYIVNVYGHTKNSIEVEYLNQFFNYGIVGLLGRLSFFLGAFYFGIKSIQETKENDKNPLRFPVIATLCMTVYFMVLFGVAMGPESAIFYVCIGLLVSYRRINSVLSERGKN